MKDKIKNVVIIIEIIVIIFLTIYIITTNINEKNTAENTNKVISNEEADKEEYIKTYNIIEKLNIYDETGNNDYYVIKEFQDDNPIVVKVQNTYNLEISQNYEFVLYGAKEKEKKYSQNEIFETFEIKDIRKTDKIGLEQIQDL